MHLQPPRAISLLMAAGVVLLLGLAIIAVVSGRYAVTPSEILASLRRGLARRESPTMSDAVLWQIRLPRIALACLVGAGLGAAGAAFQHLFRNPLVSPDTLGVSSGAALGAVLAIFAGAGAAIAAFAAFGGGLLTVALVTALATRIRAHDRVLTLVLIGGVIASLGGAALSLGTSAVATLSAANGSSVLESDNLSISSGGTVDLKDNKMIVRNQTPGSWTGSTYTRPAAPGQAGPNGATRDGAGLAGVFGQLGGGAFVGGDLRQQRAHPQFVGDDKNGGHELSVRPCFRGRFVRSRADRRCEFRK